MRDSIIFFFDARLNHIFFNAKQSMIHTTTQTTDHSSNISEKNIMSSTICNKRIPYSTLIAQAKGEPGASIYRLEQLIEEYKSKNPLFGLIKDSYLSHEDQIIIAKWANTHFMNDHELNDFFKCGFIQHRCNFRDTCNWKKWNFKELHSEIWERLEAIADAGAK
jgi:hypothetical protein